MPTTIDTHLYTQRQQKATAWSAVTPEIEDWVSPKVGEDLRRMDVIRKKVPRRAYGVERHEEEVRIREAGERARWILELGEDFDGEGSVGYAEETLVAAVEFLLRHQRLAREAMGTGISIPSIAPASEGSIDLFWESAGRQFLVNMPADPMEAISFYGQDKSWGTVSGTFLRSEERQDLLVWLLGTP